MKRSVLTQERLMALLRYDPDTGTFTWLKTRGGKRAGSVAGSIDRDGYTQIRIDNAHLYFSHRLAWLYMTGSWPAECIDHIDGCPANNKWSNLRLANKQQNSANQGLSSRNKIGLKGVYFDKSRGKFAATIKVNKRSIGLGRFASAAEAHSAYVDAARTHFGMYARER